MSAVPGHTPFGSIRCPMPCSRSRSPATALPATDRRTLRARVPMAALEQRKVRRLLPLTGFALGVGEPGEAATPIPAGDREALVAATRRAQAEHSARLAWLRDVLGVLAAAGIDALVLKGVALALTAYPAPELRPMVDVDLLVPGAQLGDALLALDTAGWSQQGELPQRHLRRGQEVDLPRAGGREARPSLAPPPCRHLLDGGRHERRPVPRSGATPAHRRPRHDDARSDRPALPRDRARQRPRLAVASAVGCRRRDAGRPGARARRPPVRGDGADVRRRSRGGGRAGAPASSLRARTALRRCARARASTWSPCSTPA